MSTTHAQAEKGNDAFLNLVDFKWLMAGVGWWVNLTRLERDKAYTDECLQRALRSDSKLLKARSVELLGLRCRVDPQATLPWRPAAELHSTAKDVSLQRNVTNQPSA